MSCRCCKSICGNLLASAGAMDSIAGVAGSDANRLTEETVKMTTIAVSVIPILVVYPFCSATTPRALR